MLDITCPHCGQGLRIDEKYAGKSGYCSHCKELLTAPEMLPPSPKKNKRRRIRLVATVAALVVVASASALGVRNVLIPRLRNPIVYVVPERGSYHSRGCRLRPPGAKGWRRQQVVERGYPPCRTCQDVSVSDGPLLDIETESVSSVPAPLTYSIVNDELIDDSLAWTRIRQSVAVSGEITPSSMRTLLREVFDKAKRKGGFEHHPHPTHIVITAYSSVEHAQSDAPYQWIGTISRLGDDRPVDIRVRDDVIKRLADPPETKYGLSESTRRVVFYESVEAAIRASEEAEARYPFPDNDGLDGSDRAAKALFDAMSRQRKLKDEIEARYDRELAERHGLSTEELHEIALEGFEKNWVSP